MPAGSPSWSTDQMAVLASTHVGRARSLSGRRFVAWHPELWVYAVAVVSFLVLVLVSLGVVGAEPAMHHAGMDHAGMSMSANSETFGAAWAGAWGHWVLMVLAMMLPVAAPHVRLVAMRSLWSRRHRAVVVFLLGYVAVWLVVGAVLLAVLVALGMEHLDGAWLVGILLVAAAWQVSRPRRRVLRRCRAIRLGAAAGIAADLNCARAGLGSGLRCMVTCWPAMLAMAVSHSLLLMVGLLAVMLTERARGANPLRRAGRPLEAWALGGFALVAAVAATVQ